MNADEFRDYILGFIFYKYLSERLYLYANSILREDGLDFAEIKEDTDDRRAILDAVAEAAIDELGDFLSAGDFKANHKPGLFPCYGGNGSRGYVAGFNREWMLFVDWSTRGTLRKCSFCFWKVPCDGASIGYRGLRCNYPKMDVF